jgi:hypothetical protein
MTLSMLLFLSPPVHAVDSGVEAFDALLKVHVVEGRVDYGGISAQAAVLDGVLSELSEARLGAPSSPEAMAFWINAYNALTLDVVSDSFPLKSIRDLDGGKVWDTRSWTVAGRTVTLNQIEHQILRPMGDPRIHAAINCASVGCPPLRGGAYTANDLGAQLDAAVARWAVGNGLVIQDETVGLNAIFDWFGEDFTRAHGPDLFDIPGIEGKPEAAINFLAPHLPAETRQQLLAGGYTTHWARYDWGLNQK